VAKFLTGETHAFTDQSRTLVACLRPSRKNQVQTLPALQPPSLVPGELEGVFVAWEPVGLALSYSVEIRTVGAEGWSPVDSFGRVQPAGAMTGLAPQSSCLVITGLSAGTTYEARVSYHASCGCKATSDPSIPCTASGGMQPPHHPMVYPGIPPVSQYTYPPVVSMPPYASQFHATTAAHQPIPTTPQSIRAPPPPPLMPSLPMVQAPPQPELQIENGGNAIIVRWKSAGSFAISYNIEVRESTTSAPNFFRRAAPQDSSESLELCIQGLAPGRSYVACVRSVAQDGTESLSSPWSCWLTLPLPLQQFEAPPPSNTLAPYSPSLTAQGTYITADKEKIVSSMLSVASFHACTELKQEKQMGVAGIQAPPEITGQEEMLFLD